MSRFATASGQLIDVFNLRDEDILLDDIAHNLAKIQRFNGSMPLNVTYSVGEHCINLVRYFQQVGGVSRLALRMMLLHDASEAYIADIVGPLKKHLPDYTSIEHRVETRINEKFLYVSDTISTSPVLKDADRRILIDEVEQIKPELLKVYIDETGLCKLGCAVTYNNHPTDVKTCFLNLANELGIIV